MKKVINWSINWPDLKHRKCCVLLWCQQRNLKTNWVHWENDSRINCWIDDSKNKSKFFYGTGNFDDYCKLQISRELSVRFKNICALNKKRFAWSSNANEIKRIFLFRVQAVHNTLESIIRKRAFAFWVWQTKFKKFLVSSRKENSRENCFIFSELLRVIGLHKLFLL